MLQLQGPTHICSDWDELMLKMKPRLLSEEELKTLVNPVFLG